MSLLRRAGYRLSKTPLRLPLIWLRHRGLGPADVMIASYPRSGNTWFRFLLADILTNHATGFDHIDRAVPQVGLHQVAMAPLPGSGRLIKTHEQYRKEYARAIYLVRDLRDVVFSYYDRGRHLGVFSEITFDTFLPLFLQGQTTTVGSWQDHVRAWLECPLAGSGDLLVIRYEDMRRETVTTLRQVVEFLGVHIDATKIQDAIARNSVERMRSQEDRSRHFPKIPEEDGRFVRKGAVGGWQGRLTPEQSELVKQYAGPQLTRLGYPSVGSAT